MKKTIFIFIIVLTMFGCNNNPWDDHIQPLNGVANQDLIELIKSNPDLSTFAGLISKTRWEQELKSSKIFTVWAPTNESLTNLDSGLANDAELLDRFVSNHIVSENILAEGNKERFTMKMASGKNLLIDNDSQTIDGIKLSGKLDVPATNGILHTVSAPIIPRKNVWEIIEESQVAALHAGYLNSLSQMIFDPAIATQTGVDPVTGKPVYDIASGMVWNNSFIVDIAQLNNEDSVYTYFLLNDDVFKQQYDRFVPYYNCGANTIKTDSLTRNAICKDLAFKGKLASNDLKGQLVSDFGVKVPITGFDVTATYQASNGIVYLVNKCDIPVQDKILPIIIEAEDSIKSVVWSVGGLSGYTRQKLLASNGFDFVLYNHQASPGRIFYLVNNANSVKYKFYWKAVNDFSYDFSFSTPNDTIWQSLEETNIIAITPSGPVFGDPFKISPGLEAVTDTTYEMATEKEVGQATYSRYRDQFIIQVSGKGKNTPLTLDYIKLVPVFE